MFQNILFSAAAGLLAGAAYVGAFAAFAAWQQRRWVRLRRKCQSCAHYPVHGSFPAVCSTCRACSKRKEGEL